MDEWMDRRMDRQMDGRTDGWIDEWMNVSIHSFITYYYLYLRIVEMKSMADRISSMRVALKDSLAQNGTL